MRRGGPDLTALLIAWSKGDETARTQIFEEVYGERRRLARGYLRRERAGHSMPPTALVHEMYLKLVDQRRVQWQNRCQFFAIAAHLMRRLLIDHARARHALKRGGGGVPVPLQANDGGANPMDVDLLALDAALQRLSLAYPRQSQLEELRFFGGLTVPETAAVLGVAPVTVKRDWAVARAWLHREVHSRIG